MAYSPSILRNLSFELNSLKAALLLLARRRQGRGRARSCAGSRQRCWSATGARARRPRRASRGGRSSRARGRRARRRDRSHRQHGSRRGGCALDRRAGLSSGLVRGSPVRGLRLRLRLRGGLRRLRLRRARGLVGCALCRSDGACLVGHRCRRTSREALHDPDRSSDGQRAPECADHRPRQGKPEAWKRWCFPAANSAGQTELGCPEGDASVPARRDVEVGVSGSLELASGGPRRSPCAKVRQLCPDALARPVAASRVWLMNEDIPSGTSAADPFDHSGPDELRKVVSGLRTADAEDLLVRAASQFCCSPLA
jgi:hypothetical protein